MRIAINTLGPSKLKAGVGNYVVSLVQELSKIDDENEYTIFVNRDNEQFFKTNNKHFQIIILPDYTRKKLLRIVWEQFRLPKLLKKMNIDLLHSPGFVAPLKMSAKSVVTVHDMTFFSHPECHTRFKRLYFQNMIPKSIASADAVIADSENTTQEICKYLHTPKEKITTVHLGVGEHFKQINRRKAKEYLKTKYHINNRFILFVGTIEPRKNVQTLVDAFLQIKDPKLKLVIVGNKGWNVAELFKVITESPIKEQIILPGYVTDEDLVKFYNAAEVFVYPSLYEGFGIPIIEAMACGCPVITSNVSSMPEVAGTAALLVDPNNANEIKNAVQKILKNKELRELLIKDGIKQAKKFSWKKTAQATLAVYKKVWQKSINR